MLLSDNPFLSLSERTFDSMWVCGRKFIYNIKQEKMSKKIPTKIHSIH